MCGSPGDGPYLNEVVYTALPVLHKYCFTKLLADCVVVLERDLLPWPHKLGPARFAQWIERLDALQLDIDPQAVQLMVNKASPQQLSDLVGQVAGAEVLKSTFKASLLKVLSTAFLLVPKCKEGGVHFFGPPKSYPPCACPRDAATHIRCYHCKYCNICMEVVE